MALLWTNPYSWETGDPVTADQMNAVNNNIKFVFAPPRKVVVVRGTGSNVVVTSTSFIPLDPATYAISIELTGLRDVRAKLTGAWVNSTGSTNQNLDFLIDGQLYASSLTATPLLNGIWLAGQNTAAVAMPVAIDIIIPTASVGSGFHTIVPVIKTSGGSLTWYGASAVFSQFEVSEVQ